MAGAGTSGQFTGRPPGRGTTAAVFLALALLPAACSSSVGGAGAPSSILTVTAKVTVTVTATPTPAATPTAPTGSPAPTSPRSSAPTEVSIAAIRHPDACSLLTHSEANALADLPLKAGVGAGSEHGVNTLCQYTRDPYLDGTAQVSIIIGDGAKKALDIDKDTLKHPFVKVPGIGDEAWQEDDAIFLRVATNWVNIGLVLLNDPKDNVQRMRQAAKIVAGRL